MNQDKIQRRYRLTQKARKLHKTSGIILMFFILVISITGMLLGWKKNSNEWIMPNTYKGTVANPSQWLPIDSLSTLAVSYMKTHTNNSVIAIDRIDLRPSKGIAKVTFINTYWMVQIDGVTGEKLHVGKRYADLIEQIHDGSIIDEIYGFSNGIFKLIYTSLIALSFILFIVTGFILWYIPLKMNR